MADFTWTEEQTRAIDLRNKNILVSAAAGSGKTALLTERLKRLVLEDGVSCRNLLVLTFTRAAASEMKQRFKQKLFDSISSKEKGKLTDKDILNEINALTDAQISTIHSFAQSMIKRHFQALGIDPDFRIADDDEIKLITDETINEVFENLFEQHEENPSKETLNFIELMDLFGGQLNNDEIKRLISDLNKFLDTLENPDEWINNFTNELDNLTNENFFDLTSLIPLKEDIKPVIETAYLTYQEIAKLYQNIPWSKKATGRERLEAEIDAIDVIYNSKSFSGLINNIKNFPTQTVNFPRSNKLSNEEKILIDQVRNLRGNASDGIYSDLKGLKEFYSSFDLNSEIKTLKELNRIFKNLIWLTKLINQEVDKKKKTLRILYFNDLEKNLLKLLDIPEIRESIQNEFQLIYLDEVQDTNGIQEAIIQKVENGSNRFMVGDIKQSIVRPYRI